MSPSTRQSRKQRRQLRQALRRKQFKQLLTLTVFAPVAVTYNATEILVDGLEATADNLEKVKDALAILIES